MGLYVFRPKPDVIAKEAMEYFERLKEITRARLDYAERTKETANTNYEHSPTNQWQWGPTLEHVEQDAEMAERMYHSIVRKLDWEKRDAWAKKFPKPKPFQSPRPWETDQKNWLKCFELGPEDKV